MTVDQYMVKSRKVKTLNHPCRHQRITPPKKLLSSTESRPRILVVERRANSHCTKTTTKRYLISIIYISDKSRPYAKSSPWNKQPFNQRLRLRLRLGFPTFNQHVTLHERTQLLHSHLNYTSCSKYTPSSQENNIYTYQSWFLLFSNTLQLQPLVSVSLSPFFFGPGLNFTKTPSNLSLLNDPFINNCLLSTSRCV